MSFNIKEGKVKVKIMKDDRGVYKTSLSSKIMTDEGEKKIFSKMIVKFKKGVEVKNQSVIEVLDGWVTFIRFENHFKDEDENSTHIDIPKLVVLDFKLIEEGIDEVYQYRKNNENKNNHEFNYSDFNINTDDLPF